MLFALVDPEGLDAVLNQLGAADPILDSALNAAGEAGYAQVVTQRCLTDEAFRQRFRARVEQRPASTRGDLRLRGTPQPTPPQRRQVRVELPASCTRLAATEPLSDPWWQIVEAHIADLCDGVTRALIGELALAGDTTWLAHRPWVEIVAARGGCSRSPRVGVVRYRRSGHSRRGVRVRPGPCPRPYGSGESDDPTESVVNIANCGSGLPRTNPILFDPTTESQHPQPNFNALLNDHDDRSPIWRISDDHL